LSALIGATTAMLAFAAPANAAPSVPQPPVLAATTLPDPTPDVLQGATNAAAGDLSYTYTDAHNAGATVTLSTGADCSTAVGRASGVFFASVPTVAEVVPAGSIATTEPVTVSLKQSTSFCQANNLNDQVVLTFPNQKDLAGVPPTLVPGPLEVDITNIKYNVGASAPLANVNVTATPSATGGWTQLAPTSAANATVVAAAVSNFSISSVAAADSNEAGVALGTVTIKGDGTDFPGNVVTPVTLSLSGGAFTKGVTPTITVPSGWKVTKDATGIVNGTPATTDPANSAYTFWVYAPTGSTGGTITVAGLKADAPGAAQVVNLSSTKPAAATPQQAINVVFQPRIGGADRYETAAKLFNQAAGSKGGVDCGAAVLIPAGTTCAVLSGGELFPDALSANYLAAALGTGTLLTQHNALPAVTRDSIISNCVGVAYITGQTAAVSTAVQNEVNAIPLCGITSVFAGTVRTVRLGGADRYATNAAVNNFANTHGGNGGTAIVASGAAPYDSLSVGPLVYTDGYPLVLTDGNGLTHGENAQLAGLGVTQAIVAGGTAVVKQSVQDSIAGTLGASNVIRVAGDTRYGTAVAFAKLATTGIDQNGNGLTDDGLYNTVANGDLDTDTLFITNGGGTAAAPTFADALAAGPVAGQSGNVILLASSPTTASSEVTKYVGGLSIGGGDVDTVLALGLQAATTNALIDSIVSALGK
jgi:putative cell wall-binding protein